MSVGGAGAAGGPRFGDGLDTGSGGFPAVSPAFTPSSSVLDSSPTIAAVGRGETTLAKGARGEGVRALQDALIVLGKLPRQPGADGAFGPGTERALATFQREAGITASGKLDRATLEALDRKLTHAPAPGSTAPPPARTSALPAPAPVTAQGAGAFLKSEAERKAYDFCKDKLFTGADLRHGIDLAVTDMDTLAVLDKLETLGPASYNNVLHALAATKENDPFTPTLLDKFIVRGTSQFGHYALSDRFCDQLKRKCEGLGNTPQNKIFRHISPDSVDRLKGWAGFAGLVRLFG